MDVVTSAQALDLKARFETSERNLRSLEETMRTTPSFAAAYGREVLQLRKDHQTQLERFNTYIYRPLFGRVFDPVLGLGASVLTITVAVGVFAAIVAAVGYIILRENRLIEQARAGQAVQGNIESLNEQAARNRTLSAQAAARGDTEAARRYAELAASQEQQAGNLTTGGAPQSFTDWLQQNAAWLGAGLLLVVLGPPVIDAFTD